MDEIVGETAAFFGGFDRLGWKTYVAPHLNGLAPDFVLLNPRVGLAVVDVVEVSDPRSLDVTRLRARLRRYRREILNLYCPRLGLRAGEGLSPAVAITTALVFTGLTTADARRALAGTGLGDVRYSPVVGRDALEAGHIEAVVPDVHRTSSAVMSPDLADDLRAWLVEPDSTSTQREALPLTPRLTEIATTRTPTGMRRIKGPAGTGKSLALAARAAQLAMDGRSVLVLSYNITLLHYLRAFALRYPAPGKGYTNRITWLHFHGWCRRVCEDLGLDAEYASLWRRVADGPDPDTEGVDDVLMERLPALVARALADPKADTSRYDAILVDEGQDFTLEWWNLIRRVLNPNGEMLLTADETQDVYGRTGAWTDDRMSRAGFSGDWIRLDASYRLPAGLVPHLRTYVTTFLTRRRAESPVAAHFQDAAEQLRFDLEPVTLRWLQVSPDEVASWAVGAALETPRLAKGGSVAFADVTLLVARHGLGLECVGLLERRGIHPIHVFGADQQTQRALKLAFFLHAPQVRACTVHSFKGWESRALVVCIDRFKTQEDRALVYVALSRLKRHSAGSYLTVVCGARELEEYGRTWPTFESLT